MPKNPGRRVSGRECQRGVIKDLTDDQGVKKLIEKLDSLYLEDINQSAYAAYESFEMFVLF